MAEMIWWGVLSTANIGRTRVIPAIQQSKNGRVTAVASRTMEKARTFADENHIPTALGSYEELIASPDIDAIYIPVPNSEHAQWSILCAEAGKPTLCEKPLASNAAEAQSMVDVFKERGVLFAEAFMYRFHPQTQRVKQMIVDGMVGEIKAMQSTFNFVARHENDIRLNKSLVGGSLMDVGCYCINVMRLMSDGEPTEVHALARIGAQSQVDESLSAVMGFPNGVMGHFDSSLRSYFTHNYEIRGTKGRISVEQGFVMPKDSETQIRYWHGDSYQEIYVPPANSYTLMAEDFAEALIDGRPPLYAPEDGVANMRAIDLLNASV